MFEMEGISQPPLCLGAGILPRRALILRKLKANTVSSVAEQQSQKESPCLPTPCYSLSRAKEVSYTRSYLNEISGWILRKK